MYCLVNGTSTLIELADCCCFSFFVPPSCLLDPDMYTKLLAGRKNILNQLLQAMLVRYQGLAAEVTMWRKMDMKMQDQALVTVREGRLGVVAEGAGTQWIQLKPWDDACEPLYII